MLSPSKKTYVYLSTIFLAIELVFGLVLMFAARQEVSAAPFAKPNAIVYVSGNITTQTWTNDNIYVITGSNTSVPSGETLTITGGTIVKFYLDTSPGNTSLIINGTLILVNTYTAVF